jgi:uncharacterized membrane protein HdeD (DUF308 family)
MLLPHWWNLVLRGLLGILFGLLALFWPGMTLLALVIVYGIYALADGVMALIAGFSRGGRHAAFILEGILGIAAGIIAFVWPGITAYALLFLIAAWAIVTGIMEVIGAFRVHRHGVWLGLAGVASVVLGVLLFSYPTRGALAVVTLIGIYGLVFGGILLGVGLRLRMGIERRLTTPTPTMPTTPQPV